MSRQRSFAVAVIRSLVVGGALVAFLGGPAARATETESALPSSRSWYAGIATGWYFPIERPSSPYSLGGGGVLLLGHQLSSRLSLRLEINMSLLGGDPHDTWSLRVTPEIKWDLFGGRLTPFLWSGVGLAYAAVYPGPDSAATLVNLGGRRQPVASHRTSGMPRGAVLLGKPATFVACAPDSSPSPSSVSSSPTLPPAASPRPRPRRQARCC